MRPRCPALRGWPNSVFEPVPAMRCVMRSKWLTGAAAAVLAVGFLPNLAEAETLRDALVRTYASNPTMTGARARLRQVDEGVAIAKADSRPNLTGSAEITQDYLGTRLRNGGRALTGGV